MKFNKIILFLFVLVLLSSFVYFSFFMSYNLFNNNKFEYYYNFCNESESENLNMIYSCLNSIVFETRNISFCYDLNLYLKNISNNNLKNYNYLDSCLYNYSLKYNESSICFNITETSKRNKCFFYFSKWNLKLCSNINNETLRNSCYFDKVIKYKDIKYCDYTENKTICIISYAKYINDSKICNYLDYKYKSKCFDILNNKTN
jgi:hypothetical protein